MKFFIMVILTALQSGVMYCAFGDGRDNSSALSYSSRLSSGDSLPATVANGLNYSFTQRAGDSFLNFSLTNNSTGTHKMAGGTLGNLRLSFLHGGGDGLSNHNPTVSGIETNFFHGAASRPYRYTGTAMTWSWADNLTSHAGVVFIDAPGVDPRSVHFAGTSLGKLSATFYQVERGGAVGQGLSADWHGRSFSFGYGALKSDYGAYWQEVSVAHRDRRGGALRLSFSSGKNDLYADAGDSRVGLTYQFGFGPGKRGSSANDNSAFGKNFTAARAATDFEDLSRVGLGAVGIGLVVSSGDAVMDQAPRFATQPQAAFAIMSVVNPISVNRNLEHGGSIYRNPDRTYSPSQLVVEGTSHSIGFDPHTLVPAGTRASAVWHTHAATDPIYVNEFFSPSDIGFAHFYTVDAYLATPMGRMFEYVLAEQTIYQYVGLNNNEFILPH